MGLCVCASVCVCVRRVPVRVRVRALHRGPGQQGAPRRAAAVVPPESPEGAVRELPPGARRVPVLLGGWHRSQRGGGPGVVHRTGHRRGPRRHNSLEYSLGPTKLQCTEMAPRPRVGSSKSRHAPSD